MVLGKSAPDLSRVGERILHPYLSRFLANPRRVKPGTTMPDVMHGMSAAGRVEAAEQLTHFLLSTSREQARPEAPDREVIKKGESLFHEVGCVACHAPRDGTAREKPVEGAPAVPLGPLETKYSISSLIRFLAAPQHVRASGRMPNLNLSPEELHDISNYLLQDVEKALPRFEVLPIERAKAVAGRTLFSKLGCANCHVLEGVVPAGGRGAPATSELAGQKACLSGASGSWPFFDLSVSQRRELAAALGAHGQASSQERQIHRALASYNCVACHQRGEYGGISKFSNDFFTTHDQNLGEAGRLPPPLTGVGAKLQTVWLSNAIAYGQSIRSYVKTRMPGFGQAAGAHLSRLFDAVDKLPEAPITPLPKNRKKAQAVRSIGQQLTGNKGMNCIACHSFGGRRSAAMAAVDLVASTGQRLKPDWFYHYLLDPLKFRSDVVMPQFFPGGKSIRPDIAGGKVEEQLTGLWHYLAEGRNTRRPSGLIRPSMEIVVGEEAVMLRRNVQNTGKRGIAVGYPGGVNLTFDAESLALNQLWWGRFVDASSVWAGQGSGAARIMERQRVDLGKGPAFAELANATAPWPAASRRELGHQFEGYELDANQRPSFQYQCHGIRIRDHSVEVRKAGGRPTLRRTLSLQGEHDTTLFFRAVRQAKIEDRGEQGIRVGKYLSLRLPPDSYHIRPTAKAQELIVEIGMVDGVGSLVIEYSFEEKAK